MAGQGAGQVSVAVVEGPAGLTALHARVAGRFARPEVRARARRYLDGLLGRVVTLQDNSPPRCSANSPPAGARRWRW